MQYVVFALIIIFYIYRTFSTAQKKAKEDAERRRRLNPQSPQQQNPPAPPKTIQEVLTEVFRETEMKTKPYGDGRKMPVPPQPIKRYEQKPPLQKPGAKPIGQKIQQPKKKELSPFLTTDYTPQKLEPEGTPSAMSKEYNPITQTSDAYLIKGKDSIRANFNIRDAVIAKIILDRPEW
jgi:hypothetical protein